MQFSSTVDIGDLQAQTRRTATSDGAHVTPAVYLTPQPAARTDEIAIDCAVPAGGQLRYEMGDVVAGRELSVTTVTLPSIHIANPVTPLPPFFPYQLITAVPVEMGTEAAGLNVTGDGGTLDLGVIAANNVAPTLTVAPAFAGVEGTEISFAASAVGPCADGGSYAWRFSDGTREFGATPSKKFTDSGSFTGMVTFTDSNGLMDSATFTVSVGNVAPRVTVVPSATVFAWGRDITLAAQAVDPGSDDQSTLTYAWAFGDGTEVSDGGPSETHRWSTPGSYPVSVRVCDKDGNCTLISLTVTVTARATTTAYTGDNAVDHSAAARLAGSVVDEFGHPVNGASVAFTLDGAAAGTASTGADGTASRTQRVDLPAGDHTVAAAFAGTPLYVASGSVDETLRVDAMATQLTYTGSLTGKPNKALPVSAKLTDALGRPLPGQHVSFQVGSQSTSGVTNAQGVATGSIKLKQKPGTYQVAVSWPGVAGRYAADSWTGAFKLNTK